MTDVAKLPSEQAKGRKFIRGIVQRYKEKAQAQSGPKPVTGIVAARRAAKMLEGMGKHVAAVETLPGGGYRVLTGEPEKISSVSEWDEAVFGSKP